MENKKSKGALNTLVHELIRFTETNHENMVIHLVLSKPFDIQVENRTYTVKRLILSYDKVMNTFQIMIECDVLKGMVDFSKLPFDAQHAIIDRLRDVRPCDRLVKKIVDVFI